VDSNADRLSRIKTLWSLQLAARQGDSAPSKVSGLLLRYYGAAYRYLLGMVQNADVAEELAQDFAVRFLRGDFQGADPQRGRFRDLLKTALRHQVIDYWRRQARDPERSPLPLPDATGLPASEPEDAAEDAAFLQGWREELLARAWEALFQFEQETGVPYATVLKFRVEQPDAAMADMARQLEQRLSRPLNEGNLRATLHRARQRFADLLLEEIEQSLETSDPQCLEDELIALGLLDYCRSALQRRRDEG
jgi:RNA polymerase sigma-70 factor (ECF subfamily)